MPAEQITDLNRYFEQDQNALSFSTSGFGHKVIKDFLQKLDGNIYYRDNQPSGIVVTVHLPALGPLEMDGIQIKATSTFGKAK